MLLVTRERDLQKEVNNFITSVPLATSLQKTTAMNNLR